MVGLGILIPVIPFVVHQFNTTGLAVGLLSMSFALCQFFAAPVLGRLSDRHGRRPLLLVSLFGSAVGYFIFGWAGSLPVLFLARILDGITGGNISIAHAYIADVTPPGDRSKNFGLVGAAYGLGFIIGPALGGVLSHLSLSAPAYFAGGLALGNTILGAFILPETHPPERRVRDPLTFAQVNPLRTVTRAFGHPSLGRTFLALFAFNVAFSGLQSNFALFTLERFRWSPLQNALLFSVIGVVGAFTQGVLMRRLAGRHSDRRLAVTGLVVQAGMYALTAAAAAAWLLYPIGAAISVGVGISSPTLTALISSGVTAEEQGAMLGVTQSVTALTRVVGPLWAGIAYDHIGHGSPYWTGAIFIAIAAALIAPSTRRPQGSRRIGQSSIGNLQS